MDIVGTARRIERRLARSVDAAVGELVRRTPPAPIEIVHAVVDQAEARVQDGGRGRRVFPFNRLVVHVLAPTDDPEMRTRVQAIVDGPPSLTDRLRERLTALGCGIDGLVCQIVFVPAVGEGWTAREFHVEFQKVATKASSARPSNVPPPLVRLTPAAGATTKRGYAFAAQRIDIGRGTEVLDSRQRVMRTNQVAFVEGADDVSQTVSRRHAHILYSAVPHEYRICDDRSVHGTAVVRNGRTIPVPPGTRGVRLQSGDEIILGKARLRVTIEAPPADPAPASRRTR
jgi:hypothetical protein